MMKAAVFHFLFTFLVVMAFLEKSGVPVISWMLNSDNRLIENVMRIGAEKPENEKEKEKESRPVEAIYECIGNWVPDPVFCSELNYSTNCPNRFTSFRSAVPTPPPDKKS